MVNEHIWDELRNTLFRARMYHQCWWYLAGTHEERGFRLSAPGQEWLFFSAAEDAFWEALVCSLASIFDNDTESISFRSLPELKPHPNYERTYQLGRLLYRYRSKAIAHSASCVARKPDGYGFGLCFDDVKTILDNSCSIYNECADAQSLCGVPDSSCDDDLRTILAKLTRATV